MQEYKGLDREEVEDLKEENARLREERTTAVRRSEKSIQKVFDASFQGVVREVCRPVHSLALHLLTPSPGHCRTSADPVRGPCHLCEGRCRALPGTRIILHA